MSRHRLDGAMGDQTTMRKIQAQFYCDMFEVQNLL